jgi:hypothetical protein
MIKFNKVFNQFQENRDNILKNKDYFSILIYFILLFFINDYFGIINLNGQSIIRRCINMYRRLDPLNYKNKLKPFCKKYNKILDKNDIIKLQSINIPKSIDLNILTRQNTTTHQCCEKYSDNEIKIIKNISEKVRQKYQDKIGKKLYYLKNREATIYRYYGNKSHHNWHVDPQNLSEIYNIIICIKKKGNISPLQCKNKDGDEYSIHFEEGDGALFNGGTTIHQVPPNDDPNSERTVLSLAFTSDKKLSKTDDSQNMCVYINGGNNYINVIKIGLTIFLLNLILTRVSGINRLSYTFIFVFFIINLFISKYIPYYFDIGLGTGRPSSIYHSFIIQIAFILMTSSIKGAIIFFSYFLTSNVFFPRKWVEYN